LRSGGPQTVTTRAGAPALGGGALATLRACPAPAGSHAPGTRQRAGTGVSGARPGPCAQTVIGRSKGPIGAGNRASPPVRWLSTDAATARPSAIAHTINDCPRAASPATKTPGTFVANPASRAM